VPAEAASHIASAASQSEPERADDEADRRRMGGAGEPAESIAPPPNRAKPMRLRSARRGFEEAI